MCDNSFGFHWLGFTWVENSSPSTWLEISTNLNKNTFVQALRGLIAALCTSTEIVLLLRRSTHMEQSQNISRKSTLGFSRVRDCSGFKSFLLNWHESDVSEVIHDSKMEKNGDQKIYRINSTRTNFIYTSDTPEEENIVYNRLVLTRRQLGVKGSTENAHTAPEKGNTEERTCVVCLQTKRFFLSSIVQSETIYSTKHLII